MTKRKQIIVSLLVALLVAFAIDCFIVIIAHYAGYDFRVVHSNSEIGLASSNNEYWLVEMSDATGQYLLYSVIQIKNASNSGPQTLYVTDDFWYHSRFAEGYGWIEDTNDFYIESSDSGTNRYYFDGTTWIPEFPN